MSTTSRISSIAALLGLALMTTFPPGRAQQPATSSQQPPPAASVVEPDAVAAPNRIGWQGVSRGLE